MATIHDVATYILERTGPITAMKLQKLCYYAFGYHLAWEERRLFDEHFEAWANGPVSPGLYAKHRGQLHVNSGDIGGNPKNLDGGEQESIDLVLAGLGHLTAHQLSTMTHNEPPWTKARERDGVTDLQRSSQPLREDEIYEHFDAVAATDDEA